MSRIGIVKIQSIANPNLKG